MTDATHSVTQSALESLTHEYLKGLGGTIREDGNRWHIHLPAHVNVAFTDSQEFDIVLGTQEDSDITDGRLLSPESDFAQQVLDEAAKMAPVGQVSLTSETVEENYEYPSWVTESTATVDHASFTPYYDKTGICVFVRLGVETVSEYQTQFLEAVALDVDSKTPLPYAAEILLSEFFQPKQSPPGGNSNGEPSVRSDELEKAVSVGQKRAVEGLQDELNSIRESASRAADSEFEEYRQLQEQRINELQKEISSLSERLQKSASTVDDADSRKQRVEALEQRRELKDEKEQAEEELSELLQRKERGYAQKRRSIYDRHSIEIQTKPLAATLVNYERGELTLELSEGGRTATLRVPYAVGAGATGEVDCKNCDERLSGENPVWVCVDGAQCRKCR
jgi:uncharacterized protein YukE